MSTKADRLMTRRAAMIRTAAATLAATGVCPPGFVFAATQTQDVQSPGLTEGPYFVDTAGGIAIPQRSNILPNTTATALADQTGFPLNIGFNVSKLANAVATPVVGAKVDVWHCTAASGAYSGVTNMGSAGNQTAYNFLRGYQLTDSHGNANFTTIYPGWYSGRVTHLHFKVRLYSGATLTYTFTSQVFFDPTITAAVYSANAPYSTHGTSGAGDVALASDMVYAGASQGNGLAVSSNAGQKMLLRMAKGGTAVNASFNVVL